MIAFNDHKSGKGTTVQNGINAGTMKISGNHVFDNLKNTDTAKLFAEARKFDDKGKPVSILLI